MKQSFGILEKLNFIICSIVFMVLSLVMSIANVIWCIVKYFKLNERVPEELFYKEMGLMDYVGQFFMKLPTFKISYAILMLAVICVFMAFIIKRDKAWQIGMEVIGSIAVVSYAVIAIVDWKGTQYFKESFGGELLILVMAIVLFLSLTTAFILLLIESRTRIQTLFLLGAAAFILFSAVIFLLFVIVAVIALCVLAYKIFSGDDDIRIIEERDLSGNLIRRWIEER